MPEQNSTRRRLVIIGGGFSGAALALQALNVGRGEISVTVVDRFGGFGPGLAYSTSDPAHLLNVHSERMSVLADAPGDFKTWLSSRNEAPIGGFAQRTAYGAYLTERMSITRQFAERGALTLVHGEAAACRVQEDRAFVGLSTGVSLAADAVVLATGHPPAHAPFDARALSAAQFKANPWDADAISSIAPDQDVLLVGSGLTMIDMVLSLTREPRSGKIYALSRRGLIPRAHTPAHAHGPLERFDPPVTLSDAVDALRREAAAMEARGEPWQWLMDRLRPDIPKLWRRMTSEQQRRFLHHARPFWDAHRHRAAPHALAHLEALRESGQLVLLAGKIVSATPSADGAVEVTLRRRGRGETEQIRVASIINCTGADPDVRRADAPLMQQLLTDGLARPHATGIGFDLDENGRLIGADGAPSPRLFAIGPPTQGAFWESTAVPEIRRRADELASLLALQMNGN